VIWLRDVAGAGVGVADLAATVEAIAACQLPSGMIPWFPGGHADPWNHTEAAMALLVGGRRAEAERALEWLVARQRPDGAWHRYERVDPGSTAIVVEEDKLDANVCAYPATGVWHHWLCHRDLGVLEALWPTVERAVDFVLDLQTPRGEVLWARHGDGTPWPYALLTGSASISLSLRCAIRIAETVGRERPDWELSAARLLEVLAAHVAGAVPDAFAPKGRWAMDWYYPVLVGALDEVVARRRLDEGWERFVLPEGVRCVADRPWVTAAETCECALAHLRVGRRDEAMALFGAAQGMRDTASGYYWTGRVLPEGVTFPADERSSYSGAAVVLCADALTGGSPASGLFTDESLSPATMRLLLRSDVPEPSGE
jgi:hypothetical protein